MDLRPAIALSLVTLIVAVLAPHGVQATQPSSSPTALGVNLVSARKPVGCDYPKPTKGALWFHCQMVSPKWFTIGGSLFSSHSVEWSVTCGKLGLVPGPTAIGQFTRNGKLDFRVNRDKQNTPAKELAYSLMSASKTCRLDVWITAATKAGGGDYVFVSWGDDKHPKSHFGADGRTP